MSEDMERVAKHFIFTADVVEMLERLQERWGTRSQVATVERAIREMAERELPQPARRGK